MALTRDYVFTVWRVTEELAAAGRTLEAILLLDGLVHKAAAATSAALPPALGVLSRCRLAEMLLAAAPGGDRALRAVECCVAVAAAPAMAAGGGGASVVSGRGRACNTGGVAFGSDGDRLLRAAQLRVAGRASGGDLAADADATDGAAGAGPVLTAALRVRVLRVAAACHRRLGAWDAALRVLAMADGVLRAAAEAGGWGGFVSGGGGSGDGGGGGGASPASPTGPAAAHAALRAGVAEDRVRALFAAAADGGFRDSSRLRGLLAATAAPALGPVGGVGGVGGDASVVAARRVAAVARVVALTFAGRVGDAVRAADALRAVDGTSAEAAALRALTALSAGEGPVAAAAAVPLLPPPPPQEQRPERSPSREGRALSSDHRSASSDAAGATADASTAVVWLSPGALSAAGSLLRLLAHSAGGRPEACAADFDDVAAAADARLQALQRAVATAPVAAATAASAELRFLVAAKVVGYAEVALADLTRLRLCEAACRLDPLVSYVTSFHRHTAHFRAAVHLLAALLALLLQRHADAEAHAAVALACGDRGERWAARLLQAFGHFAQRAGSADQRRRFAVAMEEFAAAAAATAPGTGEGGSEGDDGLGGASASHGDLAAADNDAPDVPSMAADGPPPMRVRLGFSLLHGAFFLDQHDYAHAAAVLKGAADAAKQAFGAASPIVAQALRMLAATHALAGNAEQSAMSITAAMQLAAKCGDECALAACLAWMLSRLTVVTDGDARQRAQLHQSLEECRRRYEAQVVAAQDPEKAPEVARVLGFLPHTDAYREWMDAVQLRGRTGRGVRRQRTG